MSVLRLIMYTFIYKEGEIMIKLSSILFTSLLVLLFIIAIISSFFPSILIFANILAAIAIGLLLSGIWLIISLIMDRFKDIKTEGDDYKKY